MDLVSQKVYVTPMFVLTKQVSLFFISFYIFPLVALAYIFIPLMSGLSTFLLLILINQCLIFCLVKPNTTFPLHAIHVTPFDFIFVPITFPYLASTTCFTVEPTTSSKNTTHVPLDQSTSTILSYIISSTSSKSIFFIFF